MSKDKAKKPAPKTPETPETPETAAPETPTETAAPTTDAPTEPEPAEETAEETAEEAFDLELYLAQYKAAQEAQADAEAKALRLQADFDNYRRRSKADTEAAIHRAAADLIGAILPVVDNFDRAWQAMADGPDKEGVALIARQLLDVLKNAGLTEIQAEGETFDPNLHHAVSQIEAGEAQKGKVVLVLQKGYLLHDKLLRAAMVQVGI